MTTYVTQPTVVDGHFTITADEIAQDIHRRVPTLGKLATRLAASCGIAERRWFQPLAGMTPGSSAERTAVVWLPLAAAAEQAARNALQTAGITPGDVDYLLVSSTTTPRLPGLHSALQAKLGLDTAMPLPVSQAACGAVPRLLTLASSLAHPLQPGQPGPTVLIVVAEALSTVYQPLDTSRDSVPVRLLFADSAGAVVVRNRPGPGTCLALDPHIYHDTDHAAAEYHQLVHHADGLHFCIDERGRQAVADQIARVWQRAHADRPGWVPQIGIIHPGGPWIMDATRDILPPACSLDAVTESYATGNRGGNSILDILARVVASQPAPGTPFVMAAPAPGLTTDLITGRTV